MRRPHTEETKKKISNSEKGKFVSIETRNKISASLKGRKLSDEHKDKISSVHRGRKRSDETRLRIVESWKTRAKMTEETKLKLRISYVNYLKKKTGQCSPNYNINACKHFNILMEQTGTHIQHAENGGELYIKELGYWVDGYDAENNIVYEYDEKRHFTPDGKLCERDIMRQKEIEEHLKCKFIRFNEYGYIYE